MVSALVCTRNRPDSLLRTVRSLLSGDAETFTLVVMDQSDGPATEQALLELGGDRRLQYVRSRARGKGAALNEGLRLTANPIVVCTDDDCEAPSGWVEAMARVMESQPTAAIVFCNVTTPEHDTGLGYVPAYQRVSDRRLTSLADARKGIGLGAGMALRREAILRIGGFDETLGPGARFGSGDDWDLAVRALLSGWHVYDTAQVSILHHGYRTFAEGRSHAFRDWVGIGALCAKPIRAGRFSAVPLAFLLFSTEAIWPPVRDLFQLKRPSGIARIRGFVQGFWQGMRTPVDRRTLLFRTRPAD